MITSMLAPPAMTPAQIEDFISGLMDAFHAQDVERLAAGWCDDVVIRFAGLPEIHGKEAARAWMARRFARQQGYRLDKRFMAMTGQVLGDMWTGTWRDAQTGKDMTGKGMEFLTMREGKIAVWEAVFNAWEVGGVGDSPVD